MDALLTYTCANWPVVHFRDSPFQPVLPASDCHIWLSDTHYTDHQIQYLYSVLSAEEHQRAARYHHTPDRHWFIIRRGLVRRILSAYVQVPPEKLVIHYPLYAKPYLQMAGTTYHFNVSHSSGQVVIAVCTGGSVGIDVECMQPDSGWQEIASHFFTAQETDVLQQSVMDPSVVFYQYWTRKEALLKALGSGLSDAARSVAVTDARHQCRFDSSPAERTVPMDRDWHIQSFLVRDQYWISVAYPIHIRRFEFYRTPPV